MAEYIDRDKVYELIGQTGVARVHVSDIDTLPTVDIDPESIRPHGRWINPYEQLPMAEEVVLVIVSGKPKRNITLDNAYSIFDEWLADGHTVMDFLAVIIDIYKVSGIIQQEQETAKN